MKRNTIVLALGLVACSARSPNRVVMTPRPDAKPADMGRVVRVVLATDDPRGSATSDFDWFDESGAVVASARRGAVWRLERERLGARIRAVHRDGETTPWLRALVTRSGSGLLSLSGKRYRGDFLVLPLDSTVVVVNRLVMEDYLRGVVPVEIGKRPAGDSAAVQAQAVAARSYAYVRLTDPTPRAFDLRASTADQVYGGASVENAVASAAVDATRGLVVMYRGRVVDAPFSSTCGGTTANAAELWPGPGAPYLKSVSERIGDSPRYYCEAAPRFRWTRRLTSDQLNAALAQYLGRYATVPAGGPGLARGISIQNRGPSGRVAVLDVATESGVFPVRGDDIRAVLRPAGGELLSSTYFSVAPEFDRNGLISSVTLRGQGYGHGVGLCQWGAIGRARAGQSFREILGTYYPGTTVGPVQ